MSGVIAILIATFIWGAAPAIFKYSLQDIPPFTLAFIRFFGAGILFLPFMIKHGKNLTGDEIKNILLGGLWGISINVAFFFMGLKLAPSINVHIIGSLGPIVLYFLSVYMLKEKPHSQLVKGMIISLLGTMVIVAAPFIREWQRTHGSIDGDSLKVALGNLFFMLSMLGGVLIVVYNKRVSKRINPFLITGMQFLFGAMTFAPFMMHELQSWSTSALTFSSWVGIIYGMLFSSAIAYFTHNYALTKMHAQEIGLYGYLMPVISIIVAIPLLGEFPDIFFMAGTLLIFLGIFISERHQKNKRKLS
ncbi:DMT family transporter [Candidatus Woesebacteria bacterium]|nr:DMT family transporter [Candidatus Woesebacteria bacterium]